ncbi:MAG TPA: TrkA C-terminal domain-containing protein [Nocardioidaceae bacterium]
MSDHPMPHPEVHVREHPMPGNRRVFSLTLPDGTLLTVATDPDERARDLSVTPLGSDAAAVSVRLSDVEATTLAALLSGVRFTVEVAPDQGPVDAANLRTMTIRAGSPAVGRRLHDLESPQPQDATVIAVIRDDTPDLVETDPQRPCRPGDRLVLVGRPGAMRDLVRHLLG